MMLVEKFSLGAVCKQRGFGGGRCLQMINWYILFQHNRFYRWRGAAVRIHSARKIVIIVVTSICILILLLSKFLKRTFCMRLSCLCCLQLREKNIDLDYLANHDDASGKKIIERHRLMVQLLIKPVIHNVN